MVAVVVVAVVVAVVAVLEMVAEEDSVAHLAQPQPDARL